MTNVPASKRYRLVLSAVHMVYRLVNSTFSVGELTLRLTRLLCQFIHASSASVYLIDPEKKNVCLAASFDNQINILRQKPSELKDISVQVINVTKGASVFDEHTIGLPLITDDYIGAIFIYRSEKDDAFSEFDRQMLSVFAEQVVTAIKNLQFRQQQEQIILGSIKSIGNLINKQGLSLTTHTPAYVRVVRELSTKLNINEEGLRSLEYASLLHDIGIIDVPFSILSKQQGLTPEEYKVIRQHTAQSVNLIKPVEFLKPILPIILYHHEHYDGTGYPSGLKKEQIPLGARIISVVDAFEAMLQTRPYRKALTIEQALAELKEKSGTQFDPKIVDIFLKLSRQKKFRNILSLLKG